MLKKISAVFEGLNFSSEMQQKASHVEVRTPALKRELYAHPS